MSSFVTSYKSPVVEFDPATMHPASLLSVKETSALSDRVVNETFSSEEMHPASLPSATRLIKDGYGELVLRVREGRTLRPVTKDEYAKAYQIFQKYAPCLEKEPTPLAKSRIEMMREELRVINPNIVATFIPRAIFELIFIKKAMEEDIQMQKRGYADFFTLQKNFYTNSWSFIKGKDSLQVEITKLSDVGSHLPELIDVGYRLNLAAVEEITQIAEDAEDLSYAHIQKMLDSQILFLERFAQIPIARLTPAGYSIFVYHTKLQNNITIKNLLKRVVFLECHESSIGKILLYRGGKLETDSPVRSGIPYSISLGISLFAGILKDNFACAFNFMCNRDFFPEQRDAYILVLDPAKESLRDFHILPLTAVEALYGLGEMFHCRFLCSKEESENPDCADAMTGVVLDGNGFEDSMSISEKYKLIKNSLTRQQTVDKFEGLKRENLFLIQSKSGTEGLN